MAHLTAVRSGRKCLSHQRVGIVELLSGPGPSVPCLLHQSTETIVNSYEGTLEGLEISVWYDCWVASAVLVVWEHMIKSAGLRRQKKSVVPPLQNLEIREPFFYVETSSAWTYGDLPQDGFGKQNTPRASNECSQIPTRTFNQQRKLGVLIRGYQRVR